MNKSVCSNCQGLGKTVCKSCYGTGSVSIPMLGFVTSTSCEECFGTGQIDCSSCIDDDFMDDDLIDNVNSEENHDLIEIKTNKYDDSFIEEHFDFSDDDFW